MFIARIVGTAEPVVTEVANYEWGFEYLDGVEVLVKRPRRPFARIINGGAAALSHTPAGAIASARGVLHRFLHPENNGE